jgi:iron complex outermembrane receptor protein
MTQEARYVGAQSCIDPNAAGQLRLDGSTRWDMSFARGFTLGRGAASRVQAIASLDNVMDAAIYDQCGLPQAGRTLQLQLVLR